MQEFALTINLVDDEAKIAQYKAYHRDVWPEVRACLQDVGILQMDIYALGRRLVMLVRAEDGFDLARDFGRLPSLHPRYQEWQELMGAFQEKVPEAKPGEQWSSMDHIFRLP
jgi:L-rhamnose mutarotase